MCNTTMEHLIRPTGTFPSKGNVINLSGKYRHQCVGHGLAPAAGKHLVSG